MFQVLLGLPTVVTLLQRDHMPMRSGTWALGLVNQVASYLVQPLTEAHHQPTDAYRQRWQRRHRNVG